MFVKHDFIFPELQIIPHGLSYRLYGYINSRISSDLAASWHQMHHTPLRQYLYMKNGQCHWHLSTLDNETNDIIRVLLQDSPTIDLHNASLQLKSGTPSEAINETDFVRAHLVERPAPRRIHVSFRSPASFRSGGQYHNWPELSLIYQNIINNWQYTAKEINLSDEHLLDELCAHSRFTAFRFKNCTFSLKRQQIPAFIGSFTVTLSGPEALRRLISLLFHFSVFSGVGIKTSLGMGGIHVDKEDL